jgi:arsenate reductase
MNSTPSPLHVLFLCTRNSARSQLAEAIMARKVEHLAPGRFIVASAGSDPGDTVHPMALKVLANRGIVWNGRPKSVSDLNDQTWDLIITVCDRAKETCPIVPGQPVYAHWGTDDPADVEGEAAQERAFNETVTYVGRRIDLLLALPVESLERAALRTHVQSIADEVRVPRAATVERS